MTLRYQQYLVSLRADMLHGGLYGLDAQWHEGRVQVIEAGRKQIGVDRGQFEAGITQIDRRVEWCRRVLPLVAEPRFYFDDVIEQMAFDVLQWSAQRSGQIGYHVEVFDIHRRLSVGVSVQS